MLPSGSLLGAPALLQVRWVEEAIDKPGYRLGLQFLF
jgi:hypothetical protein